MDETGETCGPQYDWGTDIEKIRTGLEEELEKIWKQTRGCGEIHYLDINTEFISSSEISKNNRLKGQFKILDICD